MTDPAFGPFLTAIAAGDLDAVLVLSDYLEEQGDPRAHDLRRVYVRLYDLWMFAPVAFRHHNPLRPLVLPLFPEFEEDQP